MVLVCFQETVPAPILDRELTDEAHFSVANSFLDPEPTDEAHFSVANSFLDPELTDEAHQCSQVIS